MFHFDNKGETDVDSFPTSILKNLLQNSDLLETLLKPMSSSTSSTPSSQSISSANSSMDLNEYNKDDFLDLNGLTEQIIDKNAKASNADGSWGGEGTSKVYGNAFLGPNLWEKSDIYDSNKFGNVRLESLDIDDFLAENSLNVSDAELLEQLTKSDLAAPSPSIDISFSSNNSDSSSNRNGKNLRSLPTSVGPTVNEFSPSTLNDEFQSEKSFCDDSNLTEKNSVPDITNLELSSNIFSNIIEKFDPAKQKFSDDDLKPQPIIKKSKKRFVPNELKDDKYWSRRKKNNVAAKRSRDARRIKENQIVLRAAFLERENETLKKQLESFKNENKSLKTKVTDYETNYILVPRK